jgi:hypothetical protein
MNDTQIMILLNMLISFFSPLLLSISHLIERISHSKCFSRNGTGLEIDSPQNDHKINEHKINVQGGSLA